MAAVTSVRVMAKAFDELYELGRSELRSLIARSGFSSVHADRIWSHLYLGLAGSIREMSEVPPKVLAFLEAAFQPASTRVAREVASSDGYTRKYVLEFGDGRRVETVRMRFTGRVTACLSTQVGCAMGCGFCATGQMGFERNLSAGEIVTQAVHVARVLGRQQTGADDDGQNAGGEKRAGRGRERLRNIVLMGMGEPLHNYEAVMKAVDILCDPGGLAIAGERVTLSTVGVIPGILRLADEKRSLHLAVSLHAATQEERAALVPVARKWPLGDLIDACRRYSEMTGRRVFYEWTLIEGRNDSPKHARAVGHLLRGLPAQVNLIPLNPTPGYEGSPAHREAAKRFQQILADEFHLPSTVRQRRGIDIAAGCGQLAVASAQGESGNIT